TVFIITRRNQIYTGSWKGRYILLSAFPVHRITY
ncbi:unnamed protein product, partial [marine sediment metagenome]